MSHMEFNTLKKILAAFVLLLSLAAFVLLLSKMELSQDSEYKGLYYYGHEVDLFKPCNLPDSFWVSHGWGSVNSDLKGFYKNRQKSLVNQFT